jgi:hypothetical protein
MVDLDCYFPKAAYRLQWLLGQAQGDPDAPWITAFETIIATTDSELNVQAATAVLQSCLTEYPSLK